MSDTPIADMVEQMLAAGSLPEMIVLAVRTVEISCETSRDASRPVTVPSRSTGAIRAARYRENIKKKQADAKANDVASAGSVRVTPSRNASRDGVTVCCNERSLFEKEEGATEKEVVVVERGKRGTRLQVDARLSPENLQFALSAGMTRDRAERAWSEFVDYWVSVPGQRGCKLDWPATWRNRVRELTGKGGRQQRGKGGEVQWRGIEGIT